MEPQQAAKTIRDYAKQVREKYRASRPDWHYPVDSPLKYVDWAMEETIQKSINLASYLFSSLGQENRDVFEFGPGTGYLMYILRECYRCDVYGCDVPDRPLYKDMHTALQITTVEDEPVVSGQVVMTLHGMYDLIVATQISFMDDWSVGGGLARFLKQCFDHLDRQGRIVLFPNPKAMGGMNLPAVMKAVGTGTWLKPFSCNYLRLEHLGTGVVLRP